MAHCGRAHVIKAALLAGILLVLLNFYNYLLESKIENSTSLSMVHVKSSQWPKRTRTSSEILNISAAAVVLSNSSHTKPLISNANYTKAANTTNTFSKNTSISQISNFNNNIKHNVTENVILAKRTMNLATTKNSKLALESHNLVALNNTQIVNTSDLYIEEYRNRSGWTETSTKTNFFQTLMTTLGLGLPNCPPYPINLDGPVEVNTTLEKLTILEHRLGPYLQPGGWFKPKNCIAKDRVAIVIPYRDRSIHLPIFLANIHPFLQKQQIEYGIFIVEQVTEGLFNRAALMNIGYVEALKMADWDCFIFHDVDLLPLDDRNLYTCPDQPRHMSVAVDTMGFKLPYSSIFGGVSAMTTKQFKTVNGFSNAFWGWGGEDDDMSNRLKHYGFHIARYPVNIARYTMLSHKKEKANPKRYEKLVNGAKKYDVEGLNSLRYKIHYLEKKILYTWVLVELKQESSS